MTWRITIFGITTATIGLICGSVMAGEMTALTALFLTGLVSVFQAINRAFDRREHLKQIEEIEAVEATFMARMERTPSTPSLSVIHGGRIQ